ncbi:MAG: hypothetical protein KF773_22215 [Deltaproteobacteria bacterium]|nr:hypothetical protein [Deltaproteobacteria bacterium]MCW5802438.1 hypothetical protein [Deltaproteobacteria bacterium]
MKRAAIILAVAFAAACGGGGDDTTGDDDGPDTRTFDQCDGDAPSFVRQAFLSLDGRRPRSQAEVDVYVDVYTQAAAAGLDPVDVTARAIMQRPEFAERWVDLIMDALRVQRMDIQTEAACWDNTVRGTVTPALATAVRDRPATMPADGNSFTMLDLMRSALALDDLTPVYRAQLFSMVSHPIPAANVGAVDAELARRADFGTTFDAAYLHRDTVCLGCHNSEQSVTDSDDPVRDRHWPVPGFAEKAVYGVSTGVSAEQAHAPFRVDGFVDAGNTRAWGWAALCGRFAAPASVGNDIAQVDAKLGRIMGRRSTVFDVEQALAKGFAQLRTAAPSGEITDPDVALAWLVTLKMTEDVYKQVTGTSLTIANYFPRNQASSELLYSLASRFATSGYSLKALLVAIVASDYFNRLPPDQHCGQDPYAYPNVFDPWVIAESDPARQKNSPGDAVTAVDPRTLISATSGALEWGPPPMASRFPDYGEPGCETLSCQQLTQACGFNQCCTTKVAACDNMGALPQVEVPFVRAIGLFLRNSESGFRGLDFQARLAWEDHNGGCVKPRWVASDFIDRLVTAGAADATATVRDTVTALKDRVIGEPSIAEGAETDALVAIVGSLDNLAGAASADSLRRVCGALVGSPQFLLQGIAGRGGERPKLTPADAGYDAVCAGLVSTGLGVPGQVVTCTPGMPLVLAAGRTATAPAPHTVPLRMIERRGIPDPRRAPAPTTTATTATGM